MSIELKGVSFIYSPDTPYTREALVGINIQFSRGEFTGVIGHTGSGKSTLMQHLNGLIKPTKGQVIVDGIDINARSLEARQVKRQVGMVFQYPEHQLFEETVFADIAYGPRNSGLEDAQIEERVRYGLRFVGLDYSEYKDRSPFSLSGGQMRRVAIAGVIALKPDYLVLDEPTAGLDPQGRDEILAQFHRLHIETGVTVLLVSHNVEHVLRLAKRIIIMQEGKILLDCSPHNIFNQDQAVLEQAGIRFPEMARLMIELAKRGKPVRTNILTIEEALAEILAWSGGGHL
jgi:energy-coupling factor transport system ATP-binding protein